MLLKLDNKKPALELDENLILLIASKRDYHIFVLAWLDILPQILPMCGHNLLNFGEVDNGDGEWQEALDERGDDGVDVGRERETGEHDDDDQHQHDVGLERGLSRVDLSLGLGKLDNVNPLTETSSSSF